MYPPLQTRLYKVLECANITTFLLHCQDQLAANRTHYFIEAQSVRKYTKERGVWEWFSYQLPIHICYYLGSFHNFWNTDNNVLVQAHNLMTRNTYSMHLAPHHPEVWSWIIEHVDPKDWQATFGDKIGGQLLRQLQIMQTRKMIVGRCWDEHYKRTEAEREKGYPPKTQKKQIAEALKALGIGSQPRSFDPFKKRSEQDWETLRQKYINENGYVIRIPGFDDIIKTKPNFMKTDDERKIEKRLNLMRIMESPATNWGRKYSSVMTWMDNIQDTSSILYPMLNMMFRVAPKAFAKILPALGWMMLPMELLDAAVQIGRAPFKGLQAKRAACDLFHSNPFSRKGQWDRMDKLKNYKPGWGDVLQALQVLYDWTGVGLALGAVMGCITDTAFGAYRYLNGQPVRFTTEPPTMLDYEKYAGKGIKYAALMNTTGQIFSEEQHFWSMACGAISTLAFAPLAYSEGIADLAEDPMKIVIPADRPTDPLTIQVIQEAGLDVERGVGWPFNDEKEISLDELSDHIAINTTDTYRDYLFRHKKDWYGFVSTAFWDHWPPILIQAFDPDSRPTIDDTDHMKVFYRMLKAPLLPTEIRDQAQAQEFFDWCNAHKELTGHLPGVQAIAEKWTSMGIPYRSVFPETMEPEGKNFWPEGFPGTEYQ
jgi:hypothetical protein